SEALRVLDQEVAHVRGTEEHDSGMVEEIDGGQAAERPLHAAGEVEWIANELESVAKIGEAFWARGKSVGGFHMSVLSSLRKRQPPATIDIVAQQPKRSKHGRAEIGTKWQRRVDGYGRVSAPIERSAQWRLGSAAARLPGRR